MILQEENWDLLLLLDCCYNIPAKIDDVSCSEKRIFNFISFSASFKMHKICPQVVTWKSNQASIHQVCLCVAHRHFNEYLTTTSQIRLIHKCFIFYQKKKKNLQKCGCQLQEGKKTRYHNIRNSNVSLDKESFSCGNIYFGIGVVVKPSKRSEIMAISWGILLN